MKYPVLITGENRVLLGRIRMTKNTASSLLEFTLFDCNDKPVAYDPSLFELEKKLLESFRNILYERSLLKQQQHENKHSDIGE